MKGKILCEIPGDGNCLFNAVLVAYVDATGGNYPIDPEGKEITNQRELRELVTNYYTQHFEDVKSFLRQMLVDAIKLQAFMGFLALKDELQNMHSNYQKLHPEDKNLCHYNGDKDIDEEIVRKYIKGLKDGNIWGGGQELDTLSKVLKVKIRLLGQPVPYNSSESTDIPELEINYIGGNHYNALISNPNNTKDTKVLEFISGIGAKVNQDKEAQASIPKSLATALANLDNKNFYLLIQVIFNKREAEHKDRDQAISKKEICYAINYLKKLKILEAEAEKQKLKLSQKTKPTKYLPTCDSLRENIRVENDPLLIQEGNLRSVIFPETNLSNFVVTYIKPNEMENEAVISEEQLLKEASKTNLDDFDIIDGHKINRVTARYSITAKSSFPSLIGMTTWQPIPNFSIITGSNGSGKTQLLKYINQALGTFHNEKVFYMEADFKLGDNTDSSYDIPLFHSDEEYNQYISNLKKVLNKKGKKAQEKEESSITIVFGDSTLTKKKPDRFFKRLVSYLYHPSRVDSIENISDEKLKLYTKDFIQDILNKMKLEDPKSFLSIIFHAYKKKMLSQSDQIAMEKNAPWQEINTILRDHGFGRHKIKVYREKTPQTKLHKWRLIRTDGDKDKETEFDDLSSGEKIIISIMVWKYSFDRSKEINKVKLILLDEPDKHLDPELSKIFLDVIKKELVKKNNIQVIMTTHRIDTVALAEENDVYIMTRKSLEVNKSRAVYRMVGNLRQTLTNREAVSILSKGLLNVTDDKNIVFVEDEDDASFYQAISAKLNSSKRYKEEGGNTKLNFVAVGINLAGDKEADNLADELEKHKKSMPNVELYDKISRKLRDYAQTKVHGGGKSKVRLKVYKCASDNVFGLIDYDYGNKQTTKVSTLPGIYSIENYLCCPINIFIFLDLQKKKFSTIYKKIISKIKASHPDFKGLQGVVNQDMLQTVVDVVAYQIQSFDPQSLKNRAKQDYKLACGHQLQYPGWILKEHIESKDSNLKSKNTKGKILWRIVAKWLYSNMGSKVKPQNAREESYKQLWRELLGSFIKKFPVDFLQEDLCNVIIHLKRSYDPAPGIKPDEKTKEEKRKARNEAKQRQDKKSKTLTFAEESVILDHIATTILKRGNESSLEQIFQQQQVKISFSASEIKMDKLNIFCTTTVKSKVEKTFSLSANGEGLDALRKSLFLSILARTKVLNQLLEWKEDKKLEPINVKLSKPQEQCIRLFCSSYSSKDTISIENTAANKQLCLISFKPKAIQDLKRFIETGINIKEWLLKTHSLPSEYHHIDQPNKLDAKIKASLLEGKRIANHSQKDDLVILRQSRQYYHIESSIEEVIRKVEFQNLKIFRDKENVVISYSNKNLSIPTSYLSTVVGTLFKIQPKGSSIQQKDDLIIFKQANGEIKEISIKSILALIVRGNLLSEPPERTVSFTARLLQERRASTGQETQLNLG